MFGWLFIEFIFLELKDQNVFFYSFDFAKTAVDILKANKYFNSNLCNAFVCDIAYEEIPSFFPVGSANFGFLIFVLSAITPERFEIVVEKIYQVCTK